MMTFIRWLKSWFVGFRHCAGCPYRARCEQMETCELMRKKD